MSAEVMVMLLADARLPTGAHTQSAGLEAALRAGMPPADVPSYIRARLLTVTAVEAGAAVVARHRTLDAAARTGGDQAAADLAVADLASALSEVDAAWVARTVSPALRETSVLLGRGYLRLISRLWPGSAGASAVAAIRRPGRAVAVGVAAALAGLTAAQLVRLVAYDDVQTVAAATLKIEPLDPVVATGWVVAAADEIERMVGDLARLTARADPGVRCARRSSSGPRSMPSTSQRLFRA